MWTKYFRPETLEGALGLLDEYAEDPGEAAIVAGGTDVLVEYEHGRRSTPTLIDITGIPGLKYVAEQDGFICIGALATHNDVISSPLCVRDALPLAQACIEVGAPQLRARATIAGNIVTASPANDTITPLMALESELVLQSVNGKRRVPLADFYRGVRQTVLSANEIVTEIRVPIDSERRGIFLKLGLRRAQAISVIDLAIAVNFGTDGAISRARIALGSVAPTIVRAASAESFLVGRQLEPEVMGEAGRLASQSIKPIKDVRGSAEYRLATVQNLVAEGLARLANGTERGSWPNEPVLLETERVSGTKSHPDAGFRASGVQPVVAVVNGETRKLRDAWRKSLLDALRDDLGLTGTKEGCAEGECGACTVWLNGQAVMSCLVPAAQADGMSIVTIEGLAATADDTQLHALQQAFIDNGAVQCGYCIPGMLMAGAKLIDERSELDIDAIQSALSGNICRCTGYRKIVDAVFAASGAMR